MNHLEVISKLEKKYNVKLQQFEEGTMAERATAQFVNGYEINHEQEIISLGLESLDISEIEAFSGLESLCSLYLGRNSITDISFLRDLKSLSTLDLSSNSITDISFLRDLKSLSTLYLSYNSITDISFLRDLKSLSTLDLRSNSITDISFLQDLKSLSTLDLSVNSITDISFLRDLKSLSTLDLSVNSITDISFLRDLKSLSTLDLSSNSITDFSFLRDLKSLSTLDLSYNSITDFSFLRDLKSLSTLNLSYNSITDFSFLRDLKSLSTLDLSSNSITDISFLRDLKSLSTLYLSSNSITDFSFLRDLKSLSTLDLSSNSITDISFLRDLKSLSTLDLSSNSITDISFLRDLKSLSTLYLNSNSITDISFLEDLKGLSTLDLKSNEIEEIPQFVAQLDLPINLEGFGTGISLEGNPIKFPPIEIVKEGNEAIIRYWERLKVEEKDYLYEAKLTLVGEGGAGKTSLSTRLRDSKCELPKGEARTRGIKIERWVFKKNKEEEHIAHIWDFGGQDVYYPVHRFFLTEDSVFVLLASTRSQEHNFDYWIPTIYQFGKNSPIILGQTCFDNMSASWNDISSFMGKTEFNIIKTQNIPYYELNLPKNNSGLNIIKSVITDQLSSLPHYGKAVPKTWIRLRERLLELAPKHVIRFEQYEEEYTKLTAPRIPEIEDIRDSAKFFHKLGIILWYHDNDILAEHVILNPEWALNAVYGIIDDEAIKQASGLIHKEDFKRIWDKKEYRNKHSILKQMLRVFNIAFEQKNIDNQYIIPALQKSIEISDVWSAHAGCVSMEYQYDFMPKGLVNQLTAELSLYTIPGEIWNNAVNLQAQDGLDCKCQVFEDFRNRKITLRAIGTSPREIIRTVQDALKLINEAYKGVEVEIIVPCICNDCVAGDSPETFKYSDLIAKLQKKGVGSIMTCNKSDDRIKIVDLLSNIGLDDFIKSQPLRDRGGDYDSSMLDKLEGIDRRVSNLKKGQRIMVDQQDQILSKQDQHLNYLIKIQDSQLSKKDVEQAVEELNQDQTEEITHNLAKYIDLALEDYQGSNANKLEEIHAELKKSQDFQAKLKLSIPFIKLLGVDLEVEFNLKDWVQRNYEKHELKIFKLLGLL